MKIIVNTTWDSNLGAVLAALIPSKGLIVSKYEEQVGITEIHVCGSREKVWTWWVNLNPMDRLSVSIPSNCFC